MDRTAYTNHKELQETAVQTARRLRHDKAAAESLAKARALLQARRRGTSPRLVAALAAMDVVLVAVAVWRVI